MQIARIGLIDGIRRFVQDLIGARGPLRPERVDDVGWTCVHIAGVRMVFSRGLERDIVVVRERLTGISARQFGALAGDFLDFVVGEGFAPCGTFVYALAELER
jgi:hypothetical protein